MIDSIVTLLKECHIFSSLDIEVCEKIAGLFEPIELQQDDVLFRQGDPSYNLYIVTNGTLFAVITTPNGDKFVGSIEKGETVGELGAISGEERTLTVKAAQHCSLLKLSSAEFLKLCHQYPTIILESIKPIISRSQKNIKLLSPEKKCTYVGVIFSRFDNNIENIKNNFVKNIPKNAKYKCVFASDVKDQAITKLFTEYEKKYHWIIVFLDREMNALSKFILEKSDTVYIVENGDQNYGLTEYTKAIVSDENFRKKIRFELILCHHKEKDFPYNTQFWLKENCFFQHHHLRANNDEDYQRVLRFLSGNAIGLVLGGGGTRGILHVGVLKALHDAKIPIDAIGGTSIGAITSSFYLAARQQYSTVYEIFERERERNKSVIAPQDFTIPLISMLNGKKATNMLKGVLKDYYIEDMWLPYFCVTTNLSSYKEESHHHGSIFEKVRGSMAIPGIFPPMVMKGEIHYDGAMGNNLPVDIMRNVVGATGKIIAVSLMNHKSQGLYCNFPPILTAKDILIKKLRFHEDNYSFPRFFDTFYMALTFGAYAKEHDNGAFADILINPDITQYSMLSVKKHQGDELFQMGETEVYKALNIWKYNDEKGTLER